MKYYILENEDLDLWRTKKALSQLGLPEPTVFRSLTEFTAFDLSTVPDRAIFLFDFYLGDGTGCDATRILRNSGHPAAQAGVIVLTGSLDGTMAIEVAQSQVDQLFFKSELNPDNLALILRRTKEAQRQRAAAKLYQTRLRSMATMLAHDLRSPLMGIQIGLELVQKESALSDVSRSLLERMHNTSDEALEIIADRLTSVSAEKQIDLEADCQVVCLDEMATQLKKIYAVQLKKRNAEIVVRHSTPFLGSRDALQDVFMNVVGNALKHAVADPLKIEIWNETTPDTAVIYVRDNGQKSDPSLIASYLDGSKRAKGHGLNYISDLMRVLGGSLTCGGDEKTYLEYRIETPVN